MFKRLLGPFISYLLFITFHLQQHRDVKNIYRKFTRTCPISILRFKSNKLPALSYFTPHPTFPAFKIFNSCSSVKRILYFITLAASGLIFHCVGWKRIYSCFVFHFFTRFKKALRNGFVWIAFCFVRDLFSFWVGLLFGWLWHDVLYPTCYFNRLCIDKKMFRKC